MSQTGKNDDFVVKFPLSNEALNDDFEAVTAVYGDIMRITSIRESHTSIELRLPYRSISMTFLLRILPSYPDTAPIFVGLGSFVLSMSKGKHEAIPIFRKSLEDVFIPGEPCLLPLACIVWSELNPPIDEYVPKVSTRRPPTPLSASLFTETEDLLKLVTCTACYDKVPKYDVASLKCKHSFCCDCLQGGLEGMLANRSALSCCGQFIPLDTIKKYCILPCKEMEDCDDWFQELTLPNPIYCPARYCGRFVPPRYIKHSEARCQHCMQNTCMYCRKEAHKGSCQEDPVFKVYRKRYGWQMCPSCKATVERTEGCNIMTCRCNQLFCYACGNEVEHHSCSCRINRA